MTDLTDNACCESRGVDQSSGRRARQFSACLEGSPRAVCCQNRLASLRDNKDVDRSFFNWSPCQQNQFSDGTLTLAHVTTEVSR